MNNPDVVFPIFFGTWVVLGVIGFVIFSLGKDAKLKRKLWPPFVIGTALLFAFFVSLMGFPAFTFIFMGPMLVLIVYLQLKNTKFCDNCGKTIMNQNFFSKPKYCFKCGEKL
jgi:hypothetical protein